MKWEQRVYGLIGIKSRMANWNADMSGRPKSLDNCDIFGSDKALKYSMKRMWLAESEKVLYMKSYKMSQKDKVEKLQPKDLNERYAEIFAAKLDKNTNSKEVLANLFSAIDVMNFGATFAEEKQNISITGVVQIGQGLNKYSETNVESIDILSPFRNSSDKKEDAQASSMGTKIITDEAHYVYPFSVNPSNYHDYLGLEIPGFEGYTEEAFTQFKKAALIAATAFNTNSKAGCENEFALFVYCQQETPLYLPNLDQYVAFRKEEKKNILDLSRLAEVLQGKQDSLEKIELYYNTYDLEVCKGDLNCIEASLY